MKYERIEIGRFIERPNRFIAYVEIAGKKETVHVKNTGRCAELLTPNASVYVQRAENPDDGKQLSSGILVSSWSKPHAHEFQRGLYRPAAKYH